MRILIVGAGGTIGSAVAAALSPKHEIVGVGRHTSPHRVDIAEADSIRALYRAVGSIDALVCAAGRSVFKPLAELGDDDFELSLHHKLMGQVNLVRLGFEHMRDGGAMVLTTGMLARAPVAGSAAITLVNAAVEGFVRAAAIEAPRGIRVNAVSPPWVAETLAARGMDPSGGLPAATLARSYVEAIESGATGRVYDFSATA